MKWFRSLVWLVAGIVVIVLLTGCGQSSPGQPRTWETYKNARYDFAFPYPSGWVATESVTNEDGQTFANPQDLAVEIQGWASQAPFETEAGGARSRPTSVQNFTTKQGLTGELQVQIGSETSSMTLVLPHNGVTYYWQGRSPGDEFASYYQFFNYVASQYRVDAP